MASLLTGTRILQAADMIIAVVGLTVGYSLGDGITPFWRLMAILAILETALSAKNA